MSAAGPTTNTPTSCKHGEHPCKFFKFCNGGLRGNGLGLLSLVETVALLSMLTVADR